MDRLLTASIIEARGAERFALVAQALEEPGIKQFYAAIARSEERHYETFLNLAYLYFPQIEVDERWQELLEIEANIVRSLPLRAALH
jgi:tRNA-(ms[2]io[6]A)-hydroxylase